MGRNEKVKKAGRNDDDEHDDDVRQDEVRPSVHDGIGGG